MREGETRCQWGAGCPRSASVRVRADATWSWAELDDVFCEHHADDIRTTERRVVSVEALSPQKKEGAGPKEDAVRTAPPGEGEE